MSNTVLGPDDIVVKKKKKDSVFPNKLFSSQGNKEWEMIWKKAGTVMGQLLGMKGESVMYKLTATKKKHFFKNYMHTYA